MYGGSGERMKTGKRKTLRGNGIVKKKGGLGGETRSETGFHLLTKAHCVIGLLYKRREVRIMKRKGKPFRSLNAFGTRKGEKGGPEKEKPFLRP